MSVKQTFELKPGGERKEHSLSSSNDLLGIVIERGIPAPYKRGTMRRVLEKMNVGESFTVPTEKLRNAVIQAAKYSRMETVSEKINGGGYRIWLLKK